MWSFDVMGVEKGVSMPRVCVRHRPWGLTIYIYVDIMFYVVFGLLGEVFDAVAGFGGEVVALPSAAVEVVEEEYPVFPIDEVTVRPFWPGARGDRVVAVVDGSFRRVRSSSAHLFAASAVLYAPSGVVAYPFHVDGGWPFLGAWASRKILEALEGRFGGRVKVRSGVRGTGRYYDSVHEEYVGDELRIGAEVVMLGLALSLGPDLVILDGPLFYRYDDERREVNGWRLSVVSSSSVPVVGVVKRVEGGERRPPAAKLCRCGEVLEYTAGLGLAVRRDSCSDVEVMAKLAMKLNVPGFYLGPFVEEVRSRRLDSFGRPDTAFWYVFFRGRVFRVEVLRSHLGKAEGHVEWLFGTVELGTGLPYHLKVADGYAKAFGGMLFSGMCRMARSRGIALGHDTAVECLEAR